MEKKTHKAIMAIDDNVTQLKIYKTLLGSNYELALVKSASEALGLMDKRDFDLILLDIEMPNVSGFEFLHEIRKKSRYMSKPVIIISSHDEQSIQDHAKNSSAFCLLIKPVDSKQLTEAIEKALAAPAQNPFGL